MRVCLIKDGLLIEPETDFEEQWMRQIKDEEMISFHKCGASKADYIGIKIKTVKSATPMRGEEG